MTPAEEYAQKLSHAVALIETHAPPRLQQSLIDLLRPAIALNVTRCDDDAIPIGASKFGGAPDVAADFEWPTWNDKPLGFLAQINLEEIAPFDVENLLPKSGLLSFFFEMETPVWGEAHQREGWRVFFWQNQELRRDIREMPQEVKCASISFEPTWSVPSEDLFFTNADISDEEDEQIESFWEEWSFPRNHQIGGYANIIQREPTEECEWWAVPQTDARQWILLFQVVSDEMIDAMWGDMGTIYFMLRRADLNNKRFEESWLIMQC